MKWKRDIIWIAILVGLVLFLIKPNSDSDREESLYLDLETIYETTDSTEIDFINCFHHLDTLKSLQTIGCSNQFYSYLDEETLLAIRFPKNQYYLGCHELNIKHVSDIEPVVQLLIYEKGKAHLGNRCTCFQIEDEPEPIDTFSVASAQLSIGGTFAIDSLWNSTLLKSVWFEHAEFRSKKGEKRTISNQLFWRIPDLGTAG